MAEGTGSGVLLCGDLNVAHEETEQSAEKTTS